MEILKEKAKQGQIQGIEIGAERKLVYQLFADNTGIFFEATKESFKAVMEAIHEFKKISGSKVNLEKSKLIQLDHGEQTEWFQRSGCTVVQDGKLIKYLGCPVGTNLTAAGDSIHLE